METPTVPSLGLKCPILSLPKSDSHEVNGSEIILWSEDKNVVDFQLKYNEEEISSNDEFIESPPIEKRVVKIENEKEESDHKEFHLCIKESSEVKGETRTFKKFRVEANDKNTDKEPDNDVNVELHYNHVKSEFIQQEEVHIKDEEYIDDSLNEKIPKPGKRTVLHQCPECPYSSNHKLILKAHYLNKHKPNTQWLHCSECSYKSHVKKYIRKHLLVHKSKAFKCPKCEYRARTKQQLTIHQVMHENMDKWCFCPLCPHKTYEKNRLRIHCLLRHSINLDNLKKFEILKCVECPYETGSKRTLQMHELTHNQSNWLRCPDCAFKTPYKNNLKRHQVQHQNVESWSRCPECSYKTPYKYDLPKHIMSHKSKDEIQRFECSQCNFKTTRNWNLKLHQMRHKKAQEIDWFFCHECSFKTKHKTSLRRHVTNHKN